MIDDGLAGVEIDGLYVVRVGEDAVDLAVIGGGGGVGGGSEENRNVAV